jgi:hypothetical protein
MKNFSCSEDAIHEISSDTISTLQDIANAIVERNKLFVAVGKTVNKLNEIPNFLFADGSTSYELISNLEKLLKEGGFDV